jgi:hypothetical protein
MPLLRRLVPRFLFAQAISGDHQAGARRHPAGSDAAQILARQQPLRRVQALVSGQVPSVVPAVFSLHAPSKVVVIAWVNDKDTKRAHESSDDA